MNFRKHITGILAAVFIILIIILQLSAIRGEEGKFSRPTSYDVGVSGNKAFYLLANKIGLKCSRFTERFDKLESAQFQGLIIISPYPELIDEKDSSKLIQWVRKGNSVLLATAEPNHIINNLNIKLDYNYTDHKSDSQTKGLLSQDISKIESLGFTRLKVDDRYFKTLLEDERGIIAAAIKYDNGEIIVFSGPEIFANGNINKADNVILIRNLLRYMEKETIAIDESLHGIVTGQKFNIPPVAKAILIQIGIIFLAFYIAAMKRFGKPRRLTTDVLRTSTEYIYSLANLFMKAKTTAFAIENGIRGFKRRISRACRITPETPDKKMIEVIKYSCPEHEGNVALILERCRKAGNKRDLPDLELLRLFEELDAISNRILS